MRETMRFVFVTAVSLLTAMSSAHAASTGCEAINGDTLQLKADTKRVGSMADGAQAINCLAVGFNGGCFGRVRDVDRAIDAQDTSRTYDLAVGETIEFAITKTGDKDIARIVVYEVGTAEIMPLDKTTWRVGHAGTFRFELAASGASGHTATARAICIPASS